MSSYQLLQITSSSESISFEKNLLKNCDYQNRCSRLLRYQDGQRLVNISGEQESDFETMMDKAIDLQPYGKVIDYDLKQKLDHREFKKASSNYLEKLDLDETISLGHCGIKKIVKNFPNLACDLKITQRKRIVDLSTSSDSRVTFPLYDFSISSLITGCEEDNILFFTSELSEPVENQNDINQFFDETLSYIEMSQTIVSIEPGLYPVIFHPHLVAEGLFSVLHAGFNPINLENGSSPLLSKIDQKIMHDSINLYQTGQHFPIDYNGYSSESCSIIKDGILSHLPVAPNIAKTLKRNANGSNFDGSWFPDLTLVAGDNSFHELIENVDHGIFLLMSGDMVMGNILQGDLNGTIQLGFLIEKGKIRGRIKNRSLGFNFYESMNNNLLGCSNEQKRFGNSQFVRTPYILLDRISIT